VKTSGNPDCLWDEEDDLHDDVLQIYDSAFNHPSHNRNQRKAEISESRLSKENRRIPEKENPAAKSGTRLEPDPQGNETRSTSHPTTV
jgi:predicted KAP-like P-loop ATPase